MMGGRMAVLVMGAVEDERCMILLFGVISSNTNLWTTIPATACAHTHSIKSSAKVLTLSDGYLNDLLSPVAWRLALHYLTFGPTTDMSPRLFHVGFFLDQLVSL
jgi:hypothetical protein